MGKTRLFVDMDGCMAEWRTSATISELLSEGYFLSLKPNKSVVNAVKQLAAEKSVETYVLSAYMPDSHYALKEKIAWLDANIPEIDDEHRIFVECGTQKHAAVPHGLRATDILLDDYSSNLHAWSAAGGRGVKLINNINGANGTWKGEKVNYRWAGERIAKTIQRIGR